MFHRDFQAGAVAGRKKLPFSVSAAAPNRPRRVDNILAGETITLRQLGLAGFAPVQAAAFLEQFRPCRTMDRSVYAAAAQQACVCGVDDGIDAMVLRDVSEDRLKYCFFRFRHIYISPFQILNCILYHSPF